MGIKNIAYFYIKNSGSGADHNNPISNFASHLIYAKNKRSKMDLVLRNRHKVHFLLDYYRAWNNMHIDKSREDYYELFDSEI